MGNREVSRAAEGRFRVGVTRDLFRPDGSFSMDTGEVGNTPDHSGIALLESVPGLTWEPLRGAVDDGGGSDRSAELRAEQVRAYDALLVFSPRITAATLEGADRLAIVARLGVGYDSVDVAACT